MPTSSTARKNLKPAKLHKANHPRKVHLALVGINGRMNRAVLQCLLGQVDFAKHYKIVGGVDSPTYAYLGKPLKNNPQFSHLPSLADVMVYQHLSEIQEPIDVVIDFSLPSATLKQIGFLDKLHKRFGVLPAYLIGTTGFATAEFNKLKTMAKKYLLLWSGNYSVGINVLLYLLRQVMGLSALADFDVEVNETHHRYKVDTPSGTAKMILNTIMESKAHKGNKANKMELIYDRHLIRAGRKSGEIGVSTRRGGGVIGEHEIYLYGEHETITLKHNAIDRMAFAFGVVKCIEFLVQIKTGKSKPNVGTDLRVNQKTSPSGSYRLYGIEDVLELGNKT